MNTRQKALILVSMLIIASMVLAACQPAAAPTPETHRRDHRRHPNCRG
jgi:hypothetical protein